ncbi:uncharacterized protein LOC126427179 [Schistocerca serialis cubense]|uniref:uncharacterized protein LOC126427179 n=1 Tax=Schistocerca serialis cubense TaxID=2023355 RepID=UPI00214E917E|nr:uncharacterized protein LOC126427179 [Schistocerca serialis cubense]
MFIKIKYADDKELLANPDCRIGSLLDYVKATMAESELFDTDLHNEIDLCDDYGSLLNVNDVEPCKNGLELRLFQPRATYFVFLISRDEDGKIASIVPTVTDMGRTVGEVANRLRQQITKSKIKQSRSTAVKRSKTSSSLFNEVKINNVSLGLQLN